MEVISLLGREQNDVYLVRIDNKQYAIKVLTKETLDTQEDVILKSLNHPYIVRCYYRLHAPRQILRVSPEAWEIIIFEHIEGYPLLCIQEHFGLSIRSVFYIMRSLLCVVAYLIMNRVVHGDIHTKNILMRKGGQITLIDFGNACVYDRMPEINPDIRACVEIAKFLFSQVKLEVVDPWIKRLELFDPKVDRTPQDIWSILKISASL